MNGLLVLVAFTLTGTVALAVLYTYQVVMVPRAVVRERVGRGRGLGLAEPKALRTDLESRVPLLRRLPLSAESREVMGKELERAGVDLRINEYLALRVGAATAGGIIGGVLGIVVGSGNIIAVLAFVGGAIAIGWTLPRLYLKDRHRQRSKRIDAQMPDALLAIAKSLRSGTGLMGALAYAATETPAPLGPELAITMRDIQLGRDVGDAFAALGSRVENADLDIAVTAILIQRTVGGNLSEILQNVSETVRERFELRREIAVITSRQRFSTIATACLPPLVALAFIGLNPELGRNLVEETAGRVALAVAVGFEIVGIVMSQLLSRVEV
jgi:tight adherence protein B